MKHLGFIKLFKFSPKSDFLKSDLIAGITVALVLIPQSLAYAQLAGLPAQFGLYASLLPPVIAAFFGSSKQLATGPVAVLSLMTAAALSPHYTLESNEYVLAAIFIALCLGLMQLFFGITKLGGLISFLSHPVIYGFTNAAAIIIATTQLSKFFGVEVAKYEHQYETVIAVFQSALKNTEPITLLLGLWSVYAMYTFRKINKKLPAVLITVVGATLLSMVINFKGALIGEVPVGLPKFMIPSVDLQLLSSLLPTILTMSIIGFTESISVAQAVAVKTKEAINPNKELVGQGISNIIGSFFQSYPVSGSFSRTAVNFQAGARSAFSSFFTCVLVFITLLFLTKFLYFIPQVVLAAVIIFSVMGLLDIRKIKHIWYTNPYDGIAAILTFFGTLYFAPHLEKGILLGVIFSIGHYLYRSMHPHVVFLSKYRDGALHNVNRFKMERCKNIAVVRLDAPLFFANSAYFENEIINDLAANKDISSVLIIATGINLVDATGEEMIKSLLFSLKTAKKTLYISDVKNQVFEVLKKTGLYAEIGEDHFFQKSDAAIRYIINYLEEAKNHEDSDNCPLRKYVKIHEAEHASLKDKRENIAYFYHKLNLHKS